MLLWPPLTGTQLSPVAPRSWVLPSGHTPGNRHDRRAKPAGRGFADRKLRGRKTQTNNNTPRPHPPCHTLQAAGVSLLTLAAWNVRCLLENPRSNRPERRTVLVARKLARYKVDIAALSETRCRWLDRSPLRHLQDEAQTSTPTKAPRCRRLVQKRLQEMQDAKIVRKAEKIQGILKLRWQDRIPHTEVLERTDVLSIQAMLRQAQLRWSSHLVRMDDNPGAGAESSRGKRASTDCYKTNPLLLMSMADALRPANNRHRHCRRPRAATCIRPPGIAA
ncbi:unnamed protein product [Schistocephalus solidus]|uniref:Endo/exonuclease/phosphatase domain-containing protein n=1 Tax=Schistocephalus solidus TaxID=70667 RepID=A0A183TCS3_SCHSO|nr:unnamed protein product [Schistocephalus solidus]